MRGPSCRPSTTISVSGPGAPEAAAPAGCWAYNAAAPANSNAHAAAARSSVVGGQLPGCGLIARVVHAGEIHGGQLLGGDVQLRHQVLAVRRQAVALGHVRTQLRPDTDYVLPTFPPRGLVCHTALRRYDTVRAGCEAALRGAVVERELPGPLPQRRPRRPPAPPAAGGAPRRGAPRAAGRAGRAPPPRAPRPPARETRWC